jgi:hypothetical protein
LPDDACVDQGIDKRSRGAVESRRFGSVQFDIAVVDAKAGKGSQNVLNQADASRFLAESRSPARTGDASYSRRNFDVRPQIGSNENNSARRRSGHEAETNGSSGQKAGATDFGRPSNGSL